jgi:glutamate synthase (NADPH/NADH) small chain
MSAFAFEYEHAKQEGVKFLWYLKPSGLMGSGKIEALELQELETVANGSLVPKAGVTKTLSVDLVVMSIGQATHTDFLEGGKLKLERGRIVIDRVTGQTTNPKYFAGGDCTNGGREVVDAVADGKRAGVAMTAWLSGKHEGKHANA